MGEKKKVIETTVETIPTPTRGSGRFTVTAISPPPGLEGSDDIEVRLSTVSIPADLYSNQKTSNAVRAKPKRKIKGKADAPMGSPWAKHCIESSANSPKNVNLSVGTPISLFAATSANREVIPSAGQSPKPALLGIPGFGGSKARLSHMSSGSARAISLVDATVGTPISLSNATAHLPRTSIYTTHIEADESMLSPRFSPRSAAGIYAPSPLAEMFVPSAFGMPPNYNAVADSAYAQADFYSLAGATVSDSMRPSLQMRSPTNAGASTPVAFSLWGQKEPLQDYYASLMNGERSTSDEDESGKGDQSPAQKWLENGTTLLQESLFVPQPESEPKAHAGGKHAKQLAYNSWPAGSFDEGSFPSMNCATIWGDSNIHYDDPSLRPLTQDASTLVWISEMAFKQSGTETREALETFDVPLKAHKSAHKAIRSLGKREAKVVRFDSAVVIVSSKEASEFMRFLASASEGGAEIRPCCVIIGPGYIHPDLHRLICYLYIPQGTCVRFCEAWEDIYSLVGSMLEPPLQSV